MNIDYWIRKSDIQIIGATQSIGSIRRKLARFDPERKIPVVFLRTELLPQFAAFLASVAQPFVLASTSNDDYCVPYIDWPNNNPDLSRAVEALLNSSNLKVWFAKNPCTVHPKLRPIPIGPKWQWRTKEFFGEDTTKQLKILQQFCGDAEFAFSTQADRKQLVYLNFGQTTDAPFFKPHQNIRRNLKDEMVRRFKWTPSAEYSQYLQDLSEYKFCISPPGRGIDTHRTWESILVGTIPVLVSSPIDEIFKNLPVLILEDLSDLTADMLRSEHSKIMNRNYDFNMLYSPHWDRVLRRECHIAPQISRTSDCAT